MKQFTTHYDTDEIFLQWLDINILLGTHSILVQIFSGVINPYLLEHISKIILMKIPDAIIIGTTTAGEILNGKMLHESIVISFSIFNQTYLKSIHLVGDDSEALGYTAAQTIVDKDTKCVIMFADGLQCIGDDILRGFNRGSLQDVIVAGGMSGDNNIMHSTYCIHGTTIFQGGIVAVALANPELEVFHTYNLSWHPIGREMTITQAKGNIVYQINYLPVLDVYEHYLGENVVSNMPGSMIEFPLIYHEGTVDIARSALDITPDGGVMFAGSIPVGKKVRFGIASPSMIDESAKKTLQLAVQHPLDGIFIYSCTGRKIFLGEALEAEFSPLAQLAPLSGFFTYGEFYHGNKSNNLLNVTTTILGLSESKTKSYNNPLEIPNITHSSLTIGALTHLVEVVMNEEKAKLESELIESNNDLHKLSQAIRQSPNSIIITDLDGNIEYVNDAFFHITGYTSDEAIGKNPRFLQSGKTSYSIYQEMWKTIQAGETWHGEFINRHKNGTEYIEAVKSAPILHTDGTISNYMAITEDITKKKHSEDQIYYLANFDPLTNLPNRRQFEERFNHLMTIAKRNNESFAVIFLDLDHFKEINDSLGHSIGDTLLIKSAERLRSIMRDEDTISRLGGDEFILLLPNTAENGAEQVAQKLLKTMSQSFSINQHELTITASIGIAIYPLDGLNMEILSQNADTAMYRAKLDGRNNYRFFTDEMQIKSMRNLQLSNALHHALERNEFHLVYQPQFCLGSGDIIGAEALLRWHHPQLGIISPAEFIPIAEASGLILPIGEWVLRTAIKQAKEWTEGGMEPMIIAVNLSAVQFRNQNLPEKIEEILNNFSFDPKYLEIELTEGVAMQDPHAAIAVMNNLHQRGIQISIDDFGTGYSSLNYLKKFKIYKLKIDQSFIHDIETDSEDKAIVRAIINIARSLNLKTIAEGVETKEQLAYLQEEDCHQVQGYFYSEPLLAEEFQKYVKTISL